MEINRLGEQPSQDIPSEFEESHREKSKDVYEREVSDVLDKLQFQFVKLRDAWYDSRAAEGKVRAKTFEESVPVFGLRSCFYAPRVGARQMMEMWSQPTTMPLIGERLTKLGLTPSNHPQMYKMYKTGKVKRCVNRMFWGKELEVKKSKKGTQQKKKGKSEEKKEKKSLFFEALEADINSR